MRDASLSFFDRAEKAYADAKDPDRFWDAPYVWNVLPIELRDFADKLRA